MILPSLRYGKALWTDDSPSPPPSAGLVTPQADSRSLEKGIETKMDDDQTEDEGCEEPPKKQKLASAVAKTTNRSIRPGRKAKAKATGRYIKATPDNDDGDPEKGVMNGIGDEGDLATEEQDEDSGSDYENDCEF